jgi:Sugar-transfer associated ATP-grasp
MRSSVAARLRSGLADEFRPWLLARGKKPYLTQLVEAVRLWRRYGTVPTQYLRAQLYLAGTDDIEAYLPYRMVEALQNAVNTDRHAEVLGDKVAFARRMAEAGVPCIPTLAVISGAGLLDADGAPIDAGALAGRAGGRPVFVKPRSGRFGGSAFRADALDEATIDRLRASGTEYIVQPAVEQRPELARLHPSSLNTVRLATWRHESEVEPVAAALKVGHGGSQVDNFSAGGIVVAIDLENGALSDWAKPAGKVGTERLYHHPDTGIAFGGATVPMWPEVVAAAVKAANAVPELGTVGWDIAVTPAGPVVVEGNKNWSGTVFQGAGIPLGKTAIGEPARRLWHDGSSGRSIAR